MEFLVLRIVERGEVRIRSVSGRGGFGRYVWYFIL